MINRDNFSAGDFELAENIVITFVIPDVDWVKRVLLGALLLTTSRENWTQRGTATPEQAEIIFTSIYDSYDEA